MPGKLLQRQDSESLKPPSADTDVDLQDDNTVNQIIESFKNEELKQQIGSKIEDRRDFLLGMRQYLGSHQKVVEHFQNIEKVNVPGNVNLHQRAAQRLLMVKEKLGDAMPSTSVALGLRNRFRPHKRNSKGLMAHPLGYALDYRATANPHITDPRLVKLLQMHIGGSINFNFGMNYTQRRQILKQMGQQTEAGGIELDSQFGQQATLFLERFDAEYQRLSSASKQFTTNLPDALQEAKSVLQELKDVDSQLKQVAKKLKRKSKKGKPELELQQQQLLEKKQQLEFQVATFKADMPKLFQPWLDQIDTQIKRIEVSAGEINLSSLPTKKELSQQEKKAKLNYKRLLKSKHKNNRKIKILDKKIASSQKKKQAFEAEIDKYQVEMDQLQSQVATLTTSKQQNRVDQKIKTLDRKMVRASKRRQKHEAEIVKWQAEVQQLKSQVVQQDEQELIAQKTLQELAHLRELLSEKAEWEVWQSLKKALREDERFVFGGKGSSTVKNPPIMQLVDKGFFSPDQELAEGETFKAHKHGFNLAFMRLMAEHGFDQGISWSPGSTDPMHFELVEGVDSIL